MSPDGTKVAFESTARNLDPGDTDTLSDIYVKNLIPGDLVLASTSDSGVKGLSGSYEPSLSADGTIVAFYSFAQNLDPADTDTVQDVYVKDLDTGDLTLASTSDTGVKGGDGSYDPSLSADGTIVAFRSNADNLDPVDTDVIADVYVKDLVTGNLTLASTSDSGVKGNNASSSPSLSAEGTKVAFSSAANNLDPVDTDFIEDVYVKELASGNIAVASTSDSEVKGDGASFFVSLSDDGTRVAFSSLANNLDPVDTDIVTDVYVKDLVTGDLTLASTSDTGVKGNGGSGFDSPSLSADGTKVAFGSFADNLDPADTDAIIDVYLKELGGASAQSTDVSVTKSDSADPVMPGQQFTYQIEVTNLGPDEATGVVLTDTLPTRLRFVSAVSPSGTCGKVGAW